jgi:hypothetical protein
MEQEKKKTQNQGIEGCNPRPNPIPDKCELLVCIINGRQARFSGLCLGRAFHPMLLRTVHWVPLVNVRHHRLMELTGNASISESCVFI